jgi:hypothetical protein
MATDFVVVVLVRAGRLDQGVELLRAVFRPGDGPLSARVVQHHIERLVVEELEGGDDLAEFGFGFHKDLLEPFEGRDGQ